MKKPSKRIREAGQKEDISMATTSSIFTSLMRITISSRPSILKHGAITMHPRLAAIYYFMPYGYGKKREERKLPLIPPPGLNRRVNIEGGFEQGIDLDDLPEFLSAGRQIGYQIVFTRFQNLFNEDAKIKRS
jgi:hypothetical protein